jgi:predicted  nucleic acid-binding Zn-ribbon protein
VAELRVLLALQGLDAEADALHARRAGLAERAALAADQAELGALAHAREEAGARRVALGREERHAEELVADVEARAREVESTLYSGKVTVIRELEALQAELRDFQRRLAAREDEELAVMEREEQLDAEIAAMDRRRQQLEARAAELRVALAAAETQIDAELARIDAQRAALLPRVPEATLAAYERLRALPRLSGRVAVPLEAGSCSGCRMALPIAMASRIQGEPSDVTVLCPHCGRLLVR